MAGVQAAGDGESGLVGVVVAREHGSSVSACGYLVDVWCLGVKNCMGPKTMDRRKLPDFVSFFFRSFSRPPVPAPLDLARHVVFGAVDYARGLGFEPHPDFAKCAGHLGEWDGPSDMLASQLVGMGRCPPGAQPGHRSHNVADPDPAGPRQEAVRLRPRPADPGADT